MSLTEMQACVRVFQSRTFVFLIKTVRRPCKFKVVYFFVRDKMTEEAYYVLKEKAVPEVLLKVEKAKLLLESGKCLSATEAAEKAGI